MTDLGAPLSREEFEALRNIARGLLQLPTAEAITERLFALHFIEQEAGTFNLTDLGKLRLRHGE